MVVESNLHLGKGIVRGDRFSIRRIVTGIPSGVLVSSASLYIKEALTDADSAAIIAKEITSSNVAGTGQVEDTGSSGTAKIRFDLVVADTEAPVADQKYYFDMEVVLDSGDILTIESGITSFREQVFRNE